MDKIEQLKQRILGGGQKKKSEEDSLRPILEFAEAFKCLPEIIGREYEVRNPNGELVFTITQRSMSAKQFSNWLEEFNKMNAERKKESEKKTPLLNKGRKRR